MSIELKNDGMEVLYDGKLIHSHFSNKVWSPSQIEASVQRVINAKLPQPAREKIIRQGGATKAGLDAYFDAFVDGIKDTLIAEAEKHRKALSYERMTIRLEQLDIQLNGLPIQVEETYIDAEGAEQVRMIDNPLRIGYEVGHVMLDGLPLQIEQPTYGVDGELAGTEMIDNPKRESVGQEHDTIEGLLAFIALDADVMVLVTARSGGL